MTNFDTSAIEDRIAAAMRRDQFWLRRQLKDFANGKEDVAKIARFHERLEESVALCEQRAQSIPKIQYPEELPVSAHRDTIIELIQNHQVIIVCGETGSGKSTQLPKLCLDAGLGRSGIIGHTQPRRIAARSISTRVAEELGSRVGEMVGYKIRFADQTSPTSLIKLMTDGILLAETQSDRFLEQYDAIILDEAHERSLNIDFLLGIFRRILQQRRDLRLIITSATIDADRFAEHFGNEHGPAPILNVEGRSYPVETRYLPASEVTNTEDGREPGLSQHIAAGLDEVFADGEGDSLVFLPTERDIREVTRHLGGHLRRRGLEKRCDILPLYARLPASEQQKIFQGSNRRRIVLATNVAESSLTVPGIRYVIDSGTARISRYSPRSKVQRLPIEDVSRASADQRAGRCGRVGPGVCIRLYSKADYEERDEFTTPEIRRTNLASVILQTKVLKLGSVDEFPFLDAPRPESIREGYRTLHEIGAIDERNELTRIGRTLGSMPVDPRVGRMIIEADERGCLPEILVIAAALEIQDPRQRPPDRKQAADEAHAKFVDGRSDFLSYLRLWRFYRNLQEDLSRNRLGKACQRNFLSLNRLREWADVHRQLKGLVSDIRKRQSDRGKKKAPDDKSPSSVADRSLSDLRIHEASEPDEATVDDGLYASIHQSLLSGLLAGVALAGEKHEYTGIGGLQFFLWPGSGVFATKPKWIVAGELLETAKRYGRNVARIDPNWLEPLASHLVKRSYADPFWSGKAQSAFCYERVTLFGLPIVIKRRKALAPIDPETARRMLIDHGLCEGELHSKARFFQHNQRLRELIAKLADKTRKREFVVDDYLVEHFYHGRLPGDVIDRITLEKFDRTHLEPKWASQCSTEAGLLEWLDKPSDGGDSESLYLSPSDLLPNMVESLDPNEFPESLQVGPTALPLSYQFDPSADDDGVTVTIPKVVLAQVSEDRLGWLVPGLIHDKIVGLIKALPKRIRRNLVPAADTATSVIEELGEDLGKTPFMPTICEQLSKRAEMQITAMDFEPSKMSESLGFYIRVLDDDGKTVAEGRDIRELRDEVGVASSPSAAADSSVVEMSDDDLHQDGLKDFTIEQLPKQVTRDRGGVRVALFPSFVDQQTSVAVRLLDNAEVSEVQTRRGLIRLYALAQHREISKQVKWLPGLNDAAVLLSPVIASDELKQGLSAFIANMAFVNREPIVRTKDAFQARLSNRGERIAMASQDASRVLLPMAEAYQTVRLSMGELKVGHLAYARDDIKAQLAGLFCEDFLISTDVEALKHYPRYLKAIAMRLDKIRSAGDKDREGFDIVNGFQLDYAHRSQDRSKASPVLEEYRWMIEELRVSVFAQSLGTAGKVSPQRLDKLRIKLERQV